MIKKISAANLKGRTFSYDLEAINVIVGENAEGKSAVIDAVLLAKLQYHPRLGKRNEDIFKLASGEYMEIKIVEDEKLKAFGWYKKPSGITYDGAKTDDTPPIMLDAKLYFELSVGKRIELVAALVELGEAAKPTGIIAQVKNIKLETNTENSETALTTICDTLREIKETNVLKWLDEGLTYLRDSLKTSNSRRKQMTAVVTGIEQLRYQETENVGKSQGVETQLTVARAELSKLQERSGELTVTKQNMTARNNRREQLALVKQPADNKKLEMDLAVTQAEVKRLEKLIARRKQSAVETQNEITAKETEVANLEARCGELAASTATVAMMATETLKHKECPTCGTKGAAWKAEYKAAQEKIVRDSNGKIKAHRNVIDMLDASLKTLHKTLADYQVEDSALHVAKGRVIAFQCEQLTQSKVNQNYELAKVELANLGEKEDSVALDAQIAQLRKTIAVQQAGIDELDSQFKLLIAQRGQTRSQIQAAAESQKLDSEIEALKAAGRLLKDRQAELVAKAFEKLLVTVNKFTSTIIQFPIQYLEGELGYTYGPQWVSASTFSGAEENALFTGLSIALAMQSKFKLVIFDEFTRFIGANKERMIKQLCKLVDEKVIDQILLCDGPETIYKVLEKQREDFKIITIE